MMNNHHVSMLNVTVKAKQVLPVDSMLKVASEVMWYSGGTPIEDKHLFIDPMQLISEQQKASDTFTLSVFAIPRHPAQLYEAGFCLFLFLLFFWLWLKKREQFPKGFFFGLFIALLFTERIISETIKENQVAFEKGMQLNMGQILSIPFIVAGIAFMVWSKKQNKFHKTPEIKNEQT